MLKKVQCVEKLLIKTWHRETLGKERMEFISQLPLYFDFYMSGSLIRMFHASKNDTHFRIMDFDNAEEKNETV